MTQSTVEQEKNYNILKNAAGDLMILIRARLDDAEQPQIIYNGGKHAGSRQPRAVKRVYERRLPGGRIAVTRVVAPRLIVVCVAY